ncbi:MAG: BamA/TamA family outer membrane protein, partial [Rhodobacteraceae bacterium]|nr:BamA/TamA family outer membrane protein [Paracoccaceae bacterium]
FLGGKTLRGFEDSGVGPRDRASGDSIGGNWFYRTTVGLTFPLGLPNEFGVRGRVFTDAGSIGENDSSFATVTDTASVRMSVGTGILWDSPFGPVNIDFAKALLKEDFDETELVRFSFGARF